MKDVVDAAPEVLLIAQCGYNVRQAIDEYMAMSFPAEWIDIPAVRNGRVYAVDASSYFSRPGPRLVTGIEVLAKLLHPAIEVNTEAERAAPPVPAHSFATRTASA